MDAPPTSDQADEILARFGFVEEKAELAV